MPSSYLKIINLFKNNSYTIVHKLKNQNYLLVFIVDSINLKSFSIDAISPRGNTTTNIRNNTILIIISDFDEDF